MSGARPVGPTIGAACVLILLAPTLSGCIAALPVAAAAAMARSRVNSQRRASAPQPSREAPRSAEAEFVVGKPLLRPDPPVSDVGTAAPAPTASARPAAVERTSPAAGAPGTRSPGPAAVATPARAPAGVGAPPAAWALMADYVGAQRLARGAGQPVRSAVLEKGVELDEPTFIPCDDKPLAAVIDLDADNGNLTKPLSAASVSAATTEAAVGLRALGVRLIYLSDRPASEGTALRQTLTRAGLYADDDRLLLADGTRKQERRWAAARSHCVVAVMGDQRSDMDELYDYLLKPEAASSLDGMWNAGWFLSPPPITSSTSAEATR